MEETIRFKIVDSDTDSNVKSVQVNRPYRKENGETVWGYVDSLHPMSIMDLLILKNTLQEYIQNNDWH
tara:strand:+ start:629 stop:832 length:204 start_codon:yes stop_codon:yes gene_type:complete